MHDGSRTPRGAGSAWDPTNLNTPARPDNFDYDSPSPANYGGATPNPQTPGGYSDEPSPQAPYASAPQTPGGYASDRTYSPYGGPTPSPLASYDGKLIIVVVFNWVVDIYLRRNAFHANPCYLLVLL